MPNQAHRGSHTVTRWIGIVLHQFASPITLILLIAALLAGVTGDLIDSTIIAAIVCGSAILGAVQEGRAAQAVESLLSRVTVTIEVERDGKRIDLPLDQVCVGDTARLTTGDIIPGDALIIAATDLSVDESAITGEAFPASKDPTAQSNAGTPLADRRNAVFEGTHVVSGTGTILIAAVGGATILGGITSALGSRRPSTSFEHGVRTFGMLLLRVMLMLVAVVLLINALLHRPLIDSLLFALALAVGITPQMLPVVVSVSLAAGARRMARQQVIVKRLDAIEDLGAIDVLCTDKTGTLTQGSIAVARAVGPDGADSDRVLRLASLNAQLQTGYINPLDVAILADRQPPAGSRSLGEVPFDFQRKRLSVATIVDGVPLLITKGAADSVLGCIRGDEDLTGARRLLTSFADSGMRVIAVASRVLDADETFVTIDSEKQMHFEGLLAFDDPIKPDAAAAIQGLGTLGVTVVVITGDDHRVTATVARALGLNTERIVTGAQLDTLNEAELRDTVADVRVFAEVAPAHKEAIVRALRATGHTVGFLGDGINDSDALHAADAGISVDTGANVAKQAAAIVLLDKNLTVVDSGIRLGRRTFANTLKYVRVASSSNFGNILSMVIASAALPFLPMLPAQILLLNFLADIPNTLISRDNVDPERVRAAGTWDMRNVTRFMLVYGVISTVFDLGMFATLSWGFSAGEVLFHSGWFVLSALTQFVAFVILRTSRPFWKSRPDTIFFGVSACVAAVAVGLAFSSFAGLFGLAALPLPLLAVIAVLVVTYGLVLELAKRITKA